MQLTKIWEQVLGATGRYPNNFFNWAVIRCWR
jgi:hypothetical protein